jgi:hypothetical protein
MRFCWICFLVLAFAATAATQVGNGPLSVPLLPEIPTISRPLFAPQISFGSVRSSPAGASNATGNNIAGATNSTLSTIPAAGNSSSLNPGYTNPAGPLFSPYNALNLFESEAPLEDEALQRGSPNDSEEMPPPPFNRGAGQIDSAYNVTPDTQSLVAAARDTRQRELLARNVRTYTNEDLVRIKQHDAESELSVFKAKPSSTVRH